MDYLYLRLAGFNFQIYFCYRQEEPEASRMVKKFHQQILKAYRDFSIKKPSKIDQHIEIHFKLPIIYPTTINIKGSSMIFFEEKDNLIIASAHLSLYQFSFLLLTLLQRLLSKNQGFILHASASIINGQAYLFLAPSGGGKTTAIRLLSIKYKPLANDAVAIRQEKNNYIVYQTPLLEEFKPKIKNTVKGFSMGKLLLLQKAKFTKIQPLKKTNDLIWKISPQFRTSSRPDKEQMALFLSFMGNNIFYKLYFRKKSSDLLKQNINFF